MFEELFTDGSTIERCRAAPLLDERLCWLEHCAESGARPNTLRRIASCQFHLAHLLDLQAGDRVDITRIEAAAGRWVRHGRCPPHGSATRDAHQWFVGHALRWLRFADMFAEEPCRPQHPHAAEVAVFARWMCTERGWAEATVRNCCSNVDRFLVRLNDCSGTLDTGRIEDINEQVAHWHACGLSRATIRDYAKHLRTFFRFAEGRD